LNPTSGITEIDEGNSAMIATTRNPASQRDGLPNLALANRACPVRTDQFSYLAFLSFKY
jgi:hypothetical protein